VVIHQCVAASNSLSFWNILTDISSTFTWNDLDTRNGTKTRNKY